MIELSLFYIIDFLAWIYIDLGQVDQASRPPVAEVWWPISATRCASPDPYTYMQIRIHMNMHDM